MKKAARKKNGNGNLESAMALLINNQAQFVSEMTDINRRYNDVIAHDLSIPIFSPRIKWESMKSSVRSSRVQTAAARGPLRKANGNRSGFASAMRGHRAARSATGSAGLRG